MVRLTNLMTGHERGIHRHFINKDYYLVVLYLEKWSFLSNFNYCVFVIVFVLERCGFFQVFVTKLDYAAFQTFSIRICYSTLRNINHDKADGQS